MLPPPQPASTTKRANKLLPRNQRLIPRFLVRRDARPIPPSKSPGTGKTTVRAASRLPLLSGKENATRLVGAVIVSVDVTELEPRVTDDGETLQEANGAGPVTVQLRFTCPEKLFCSVKVSASVTCIPVFMVKLADAATIVKSGARANVAVTDWAEFMTMVQVLGSVPVHAPLHPEKTDPVAAFAPRLTDVPCA